MSSADCCLTRKPPSPDGLAPRCVPSASSNSPSKLRKSPPKDFPSLSTASRLSKPEDIAELQAIFEEEKGSTTDSQGRVKARKSSSTLKAVKKRVKKHFSRDSGVSKRNSRTSIGTSEEEVERRAELRRIREQRIRDELSNDIYDSDAKSLSTIPALNSSSKRGKRSTWNSGKHISASTLSQEVGGACAAGGAHLFLSPCLTRPKILYSDSSMLALPPRSLSERVSTLEAKINEFTSSRIPSTELSSVRPLRRRSETDLTESSSILVNITIASRRYSSPCLLTPEFEIDEPNVYFPRRKRSSIAAIPFAPILQPQHPPSLNGKSSWRLSFSSENRGAYLRKLSQGGTVIAGDKTQVGPQPIKRWLHSQGLRSPSQAIAASEDNPSLGCLASHSHTFSANQDFGGVDGGSEGSDSIIHLHEMDISQRLASPRSFLQVSASTQELSSVESRSQGGEASTISRDSKSKYRRVLQHTSDSMPLSQNSIPLSQRIPESWGNVVQDGPASIYPSASPSMQPTPTSSRFNLLSIWSGSKSKLDLIESSENEQAQALANPSSVPADSSRNSRVYPLINYHRCPTVDTSSSLIISETESFREREAELNIIKTRFPDSDKCGSPITPRSSKFREEFDLDASPVAVPIPTRRSNFKRLAKFAARTYDGPMDKLLGAHSGGRDRHLSSAERDLVPGGFLNTHLPGKDLPHFDNHPVGKGRLGSVAARKTSHVGDHTKRKEGKLGGWLKSGDDSSEDDETKKKKTAEEEAMDDWEREMNKTAQKAKAKSRNIVKKAKLGPDRRYPASWSKFPGYDREERMSSAGSNERVEAKDFAVADSKDGKTIWYHSERSQHLYHYEGDNDESHLSETKTGFLGRLEQKIQRKLSMMEGGKEEIEEDQTYGRRGSRFLGLQPEDPELEMLPIEVMTSAQIEAHVEEVLEQEDLQRKEDEIDAMFGIRKPKKPETPPLLPEEEKIEEEQPKKRKKKKRVVEDDDIEMETMGDTEKPKGRSKLDKMGAGEGSSTSRLDKMDAGERPSKLDKMGAGGRSSKLDKMAAGSPQPSKVQRQPTPPMDTAGMAGLQADIDARAAMKKKAEERAKMTPEERMAAWRAKQAERKPNEPAPAPTVDSPVVNTPAVDGSVDSLADATSDDDLLDASCVSIADPRFYDDCVVSPPTDEDREDRTESGTGNEAEDIEDTADSETRLDIGGTGSEIQELSPRVDSRKEKFKTWAGRDWDRYKLNDEMISPRRRLSMGILRKSTDEFHWELEVAERVEREKVMKAVEEAWGG